ncbi:MAG: DNA repair protein RecO [Chloroflexota bacterium]
MAAPRLYKTEGIVLRRSDMGEADLLLTFYTPFYGKLRAVARGARRPSSKLAGHVELLARGLFLLARGQNLDTFSQAECVEPFAALRDDLESVGRALYVAELLDRFTPDGAENRLLYQLLVETLRRFPAGGDMAVRFFEVQALVLSGFRPDLHTCVECGAAVTPGHHLFSASGGGVLCPRCRDQEPVVRPLSLNALKVLRLLDRGDYAEAARLRISAELAGEVEQALRQYIWYLLEREVKAISFMDRVRRGEPDPA